MSNHGARTTTERPYLSIGEVAIPLDPTTHQPLYSPEGLLWMSTIWIVGLLAVFIPLSIRMYRRLA